MRICVVICRERLQISSLDENLLGIVEASIFSNLLYLLFPFRKREEKKARKSKLNEMLLSNEYVVLSKNTEGTISNCLLTRWPFAMARRKILSSFEHFGKVKVT